MPLLMRLFIKLVINSLALFAADYLVSGIVIKDFWSGVIAAGLLGIMNASLKPVIVILTLPINLISLGLFTF
ncbi:MAG TPA: phage holin family protein, partial [Nitrospirota bacterium]